MSTDELSHGRYRLVSLLGEGGMGKVYKGYDAALDRSIAIKILPPEFVADASRVGRFIQEARAASALNHPHVVSIYDIGEDRLEPDSGPVRYIAMELVDGVTVRELIRTGSIELRKALRIVMQVAEALAAAHAAGIVHRDLKPENIMVTSSGYAKVLDFGLAKLRLRETASDDASRTIEKITDPGTVMGTAAYMAPEQAQGKSVDHRSDLFSLGCILYEIASGKRAFQGDSSVDTLHRIIYAEPEPLRNVRASLPPELARIVRKALVKDPEERYQSAKDLAIDLRELLREIDTNPGGVSFEGAAPAAPPSRRPSWIVPVAGAAALVLVIAVVATLMGRRDPPAQTEAPPALGISRVTATGKVIAATISPDGKYIAYVSSDQGEQELLLRQLATGQTLQLVPPRRASYWGLTFTPDGSSVYFGEKSATYTSGAISQIAALGGSVRKVIEGIDSAPTFSPDGTRMAFLRATHPTAEQSALMVANADGSGARALAIVRAPERFVPVFFAGASWSPDGKLIATCIVNAKEQRSRVVTVDAGSGAIETVAAAGWEYAAHPVWMPDQKGLVFVAPPKAFDRAQVWYVEVPRGEPRPITSDLFDYRALSVTADGTSLVAVASDNSADVWMHRSSAAPKKLTAARLEGAYGVDVLPDGRIAFTSLENAKNDIWLMNADGGGRTLVTRDAYENLYPTVAPDGRTIVYCSVTPRSTEICRINADGSDRRVLATGATRGNAPAIAPDGKWVVYGAGDPIPSLVRVPMEGGPPQKLTTYSATSPAFSPDGSRIAAYVRLVPGGPIELAILPAEGGKPLQTIDFAPPFFRGMIRWTADGKALIVNTAPSDRANLWLLPLDGTKPQRLTQFDERLILGFAPAPGGDGWVLSRGDLSRDAVMITGFRRPSS